MSQLANSHVLPPAHLPPGHRCRVDDLAYTKLSDWYVDHHGYVPIQAAHALSRYMRGHGCTFAEAFVALTNGWPIILIEPDTEPDRGSNSDP